MLKSIMIVLFLLITFIVYYGLYIPYITKKLYNYYSIKDRLLRYEYNEELNEELTEGIHVMLNAINVEVGFIKRDKPYIKSMIKTLKIISEVDGEEMKQAEEKTKDCIEGIKRDQTTRQIYEEINKLHRKYFRRKDKVIYLYFRLEMMVAKIELSILEYLKKYKNAKKVKIDKKELHNKYNNSQTITSEFENFQEIFLKKAL